MPPLSLVFPMQTIAPKVLLPLCLILGYPFQVEIAYAQSITPNVDGVGTTVQSSTNPNQFDIIGGTQSGTNLFHSFQRFGLNQGQIANFLTNPSIQNVLSRVTGGEASYINGLVQVTGSRANLFLMNPAGIVFGANARLNVPAAFTATTANAIALGSDQWFNATGSNNFANLSGTPNGFAFLTNPSGAIVNAGTLQVNPGQAITLLGGTVLNTGTIAAPGGNITIASVSGEKLVRLSQDGSLLSLELPLESRSSIHSPISSPLSLPALLTGGGLASATGVTVDNGVIRLSSGTVISPDAGTTISSGNLQASAANALGKIAVLGDRVALLDQAKVDVSAIGGGGTVLIGGDFQGQGSVPNANRTFVSSKAVINADAIKFGNGGQVVVWSNEATRFYGSVTARGGETSGNGGFVEVSGRDFLEYQGQVDTLAPQGLPGTLLLDPVNITIVAGSNNPPELAANDQFADPGVNNTINNGTINAATSNIILQATNNITFSSAVNIATAGVGLTAQANNDITVTAPITTNGGAIDLTADADNSGAGRVVMGANVSTNSGAVTLKGRGLNNPGVQVATGTTIAAGGGNVTITGSSSGATVAADGVVVSGNIASGGGAISVTGTTTATGNGVVGIDITPGGILNSAGGNISLNGTSTSTGLGAFGVHVREQVLSAGGTISINGTSQPGAESVLVRSPINSGAGSISITGNGSGITTLAAGSITASGGNITLQNTTSNFWGIALQSPISSGGGAITLNGNGGTTVDAFGVVQVTPISSAGGNIRITGTSLSRDGIAIGDVLDSGTGNITLTADRVNLNPGALEFVQGTGTLLIQPLTPSTNLQVGGSGTPDTTFLTTGELSRISGGFNSLIIGRVDSSGLIRQEDNLTFTLPVTLRSPVGAGSIETTGFTLEGTANANFTLLANQAITTGTILNPGRNLMLTSLSSRIDTTSGTLDTSSPTNGGTIMLRAKTDILVNSINAQGGIQGGVVDLGSDRFIRATGTFNAQDGSIASFSAAGGQAAGSISIQHGGLAPFTIGDAATNGTLGVVTDGFQPLRPFTQILNLPGVFTQGGIRITPGGILVVEPPVPQPPVPQHPVPQLEVQPPSTNFPIELATTLEGNLSFFSVEDESSLTSFGQPVLSDVIRQQVSIALDEGDIAGAIALLEKALTQQYQFHLKLQLLPASNLAQEVTGSLNLLTSLEDIQLALQKLHAQTGFKPAIIYALSRSDQLDLILVPPDTKPIYRAVRSASNAQLMQQLQAFRSQVTDFKQTRTQSYRRQAEILHQWLITPLEPDLKRLQINTLVFALDEGLRATPLAALHDGQTFLVERYNLSLIPSFNLVNPRYGDVRKATVLAMGASQFTNLSPLPAVPAELATIVGAAETSTSSTSGLWNGRSFLNQGFTLANLQKQHQQQPAGVIHLATHAEFQSGQLDNSYIQLWDQKLLLSQLRQLGWADAAVELLVLSACQTALGDRDAELGFGGLAVQAGVKTAMGSLWSVSDEGTLALIQAFYRQLRQTSIKAEALRQAQLEFIKGAIRIEQGRLITVNGTIPLPSELTAVRNTSLSHPYYWAAFTIIGSPW